MTDYRVWPRPAERQRDDIDGLIHLLRRHCAPLTAEDAEQLYGQIESLVELGEQTEDGESLAYALGILALLVRVVRGESVAEQPGDRRAAFLLSHRLTRTAAPPC